MAEDKRMHVKAAISHKLDLVADYIGITSPALIAVMLDEYVRARPDILAKLNEVKPTSVAAKEKVEEIPEWQRMGIDPPPARYHVPDEARRQVLADWGEDD